MAPEAPLTGATAVVTGALGRLGPVWVAALAGAGADVVGVDIGERGVDELQSSLEGVPGSFRLERADVTDRAALDTIAAGLPEAPRVLVVSAGIDQPPTGTPRTYRPEDVPGEDFRGTVDVNLNGAFFTLQAFGARMAAAGRGSIVTVGSLYAGIAPIPAFYEHMEADPPFLKPAAYGASKAGLLNLTKYFARLWGPQGVRVNALSPGGVAGGQDEKFIAKFTDRVPLGRLCEPGELAGPLLFLATDASSYLTGHELKVDGGFTA
jgi:NAD(P)-dependent dehydrogenase (short-subunit alcohol dehydrogenase family)